MKYCNVLIVLFLVMIGSCKEEIQPQLSDEKLVDIITDLHLAEAALLTLNKKMKDSISVVYYNQVFEIHEVKDSVFYKDLELIRRDAIKVEEIYTRVIDNLAQLELKKEAEETP